MVILKVLTVKREFYWYGEIANIVSWDAVILGVALTGMAVVWVLRLLRF
jgi:hypothetical protein